MKKILLFVLIFYSISTPAKIIIERIRLPINNQAAIERGAKFFASTCLSCHSLKYLKNDPIATAAGITPDKMPVQNAEWWAGRPPPDLTLIAQARGPRWIYVYLHSFYQDSSRPTGVNNLLVNNTNMPNPFIALQGIQTLVVDKKDLSAQSNKKLRWFDAIKLEKQGSMSPEEFDKTIGDVTAFLVYASEPAKSERLFIGWWVLAYLIIFAIVTFLLNRSYWKNIK
jgi:ubiquinol-cytochrome c reductase cytochrome c1 subunit